MHFFFLPQIVCRVNYSLLLFLLLLPSTLLWGQTDSTTVKPNTDSPRKQLRKAKKQLRSGNLYDATDALEGYLQLKPEKVKYAWQLAEAYRVARDYKSAEKWYKHVYEQSPDAYREALYFYALMAKMNGKYMEGLALFQQFQKSYKGKDTYYKKWAKTEAEGCELALRLQKQPVPVVLNHLGAEVNSPYTDISPVFWNDSTLLFASLPSDTVIRYNERDTTQYRHYIKFYSAPAAGATFAEATPFTQFQYEDSHVGNGAFSVDGKSFYFTRCFEERRNEIFCNIYVSEWKDGQWQTPIALGPEVNQPGYNITQPNIGADDKGQEVLYFASNQPGGRGGMDIWYAIKKKGGGFAAAKNAGKLNTDRNEATPFYDVETHTLYFSSNGHVGVGGYDIFKTVGSINKWTEPEHLGYPYNSQTDDMYFRINQDRVTGFVVSNRPGIISIKSETCCDDIFMFAPPQPKLIAVKGFVLDKNDPTKTPVNNALVVLALTDDGGNRVDVDLARDTTQNNQEYFFSIDFEKSYKVNGSAVGWIPGSSSFNTLGLVESDTLHVDIYLQKLVIGKAYRLRNIYYDYDKWFLRDASKLTLDTLYNLMMENPTIIVELGSHTDTRATDKYNLNLSQRRAESAVKYLISRGIPKERLVAKGYGETQVMEDCSGYKDCPEAGEGDCPCHQNNRRTEFMIIGTLDAPLNYEDKRYGDGK
ncbi:OmpA family protein [soil metagenome]